MKSNSQSRAALLTLLMLCVCGSVMAQATPATNTPHNPYTIPGFLVRGEMQVGIPEPFGTIVQDMGPVTFQEIAPCTLVSTLEKDQYATAWGGPRFTPFTARTYKAVGFLSDANFVNPCSGAIPANARALALRVHAINPTAVGAFVLSRGPVPPATGLTALSFSPTADHGDTMEEAGVMLASDGTFMLSVNDASADAVVEVTGYFLPDAQKAQIVTGLSLFTVEGDSVMIIDSVNNMVDGEACVSVPADAAVAQCMVTFTPTPFIVGRPVPITETLPCRAVNDNGCLRVFATGHFKVTMIGPTNPNQ